MMHGFPGSIQPAFMKKQHSPSPTSNQDDDLGDDGMFGKVMILFFKKQRSSVTELETFLKKTRAESRALGAYFGFEEGRKWEEFLLVFHQFREQFSKAVREMNVRRQKEQRKQNQNEKKSQLAEAMKNRPKKEEVVRKFNFSPDADQENVHEKGGGSVILGQQAKDAKSAPKKSSNSSKGKASAMYAAYKNNQKQGVSHSKKTWV